MTFLTDRILPPVSRCGARLLACLVALVVLGHSASALAQNLVENPGFENGSAGWNGGTVVSDQCHGGDSCLLVDDESQTASISASTAQLIPVDQAGSYHVVVWVRAALEGQAVQITLNQYDAQQQWLSGRNIDWPVTIGSAWTKVERTVRSLDANTAFLRLYLRPVRWTAGGELVGQAWFDDLVIEEVADDQQSVEGDWIRTDGPVLLWQAPVEQKVRPGIQPPGQTVSASGLHVDAARGEYEAIQFVLTPTRNISLDEVVVTDAQGPDLVPASAWTVRQVVYVEVTSPSDYASFLGPMPDPLPLVDGPIALTAGENQPLWLTIHVPDVPAGIYHAYIRLSFQGQPAMEVPIELRVRDFTLGRKRHLRTAYGLSMRAIDRYHGLAGDRDLRRQVWRLYLQDFAAHRVSPYNPVGDDSYRVSWGDWNWDGGLVVDDPEGSGSRVLEVDDQDSNGSVSVGTSRLVPVDPGGSYVLSWRGMTDGVHEYEVSIQQYDAAQQWISGSNVDFVAGGTGQWQSETRSIDPGSLLAQTRFLGIRLYAVPWSSDGAGLGRTWFDDLVLHSEADQTNLLVNGDFEETADDLNVTVDFSAFDEAATYAFDDLGLDSFRVFLPQFGRGSFEGRSPGHVMQWDWTDPEYEVLYGRFLGQLTSHLQERGWLDKSYAYWFDEPQVDDYDFVAFGMEMLGRHAPGLSRLLTEEYSQALDGTVDIWVPVLNRYESGWAHERQQAGEHVWWYVCTGPKAPYPNNFIDHVGIEPRIRFWLAFKEGIEGSLYWSVNYWTNDTMFPPPQYQDPWQDTASYSSSSQRNWGNGDGRLVYPPKNWKNPGPHLVGPTPSIRWELIRDGIEDYEYLWLLSSLRDRLHSERPDLRDPDCLAQTLPVPDALVSSPTSYSTSGKTLEAQRRLVADCIEEMQSLLHHLDGGDVDVVDGSVVDVDAGAGTDATEGRSAAGTGCGCRTSTQSAWGGVLWLLSLLSLLFLTRRRKQGR